MLSQVQRKHRITMIESVVAGGACFVFLFVLGGCGGDGLKRVTVHGNITADGQPLDEALLFFTPTGSTKGPGATARSDKVGAFSLIDARSQGKVVVPGDYKVSVVRFVNPDGSVVADMAQSTSGVRQSMPRRLTSAVDTPLNCTIPETGGTVNIDIPAEHMVER